MKTVGNPDGPAGVCADGVDRLLGAPEVGTCVVSEDTVLAARDDLDVNPPAEGIPGFHSSLLLEPEAASGMGGISALMMVTEVSIRRWGAARIEVDFLTERRVGTGISTE